MNCAQKVVREDNFWSDMLGVILLTHYGAKLRNTLYFNAALSY